MRIGNQYTRNPTTTAERFWAKVSGAFTQKGVCWEWTGALNESGYGIFWLKPHCVLANRLAWELINGPIVDEW